MHMSPLKGSLSFLKPSEIARIGGRSKEEALDICNLKELKNAAPKSKYIQGKYVSKTKEVSPVKRPT